MEKVGRASRRRTFAVLLTGVIVAALTACFSGPAVVPIYDYPEEVLDEPQGFEDDTSGFEDDTGGFEDDTAGFETLSPPTTETVQMMDPVAQSFTVEVPAGWDSTAYSTGVFSDHRQSVVSVSPDGNTVLFYGEPNAPAYWSPSAPENQIDAVRGLIDQMELAEWREYEPATLWGEAWVVGKFGALEGFQLVGTVELSDLAAQITNNFRQSLGTEITVTAAQTDFQYTTGNGSMNGRVVSVTFGNHQTWNIMVQGLATLGNPDDYDGMREAMGDSVRTTPEWQSKQQQFWQNMDAQSQAFTQQLIDNHNANMAWIRNSAAAHQQKMQSIWAANDASMNNYYQRMASMDNNQRSFLNFIQSEHTVQNSAGQTFQVPQGPDVFYVNPSTGQSVGGNVNFSEQDLIAMGLNPSDWTLTEIIR